MFEVKFVTVRQILLSGALRNRFVCRGMRGKSGVFAIYADSTDF